MEWTQWLYGRKACCENSEGQITSKTVKDPEKGGAATFQMNKWGNDVKINSQCAYIQSQEEKKDEGYQFDKTKALVSILADYSF